MDEILELQRNLEDQAAAFYALDFELLVRVPEDLVVSLTAAGMRMSGRLRSAQEVALDVLQSWAARPFPLTTPKARKQGPQALERVPPDLCHIEGVENLTTAQQVARLRTFIAHSDRPAFVRLGASSPESRSVTIRRVVKTMSQNVQRRASLIPGRRRNYTTPQLLALLLEVQREQPGTVDAKIASRTLSRLERAPNSKPYSVYAVDVAGVVSVVRRNEEDARVSWRWMKTPGRPWNLSRLSHGTGVDHASKS